MAGWLGGFAKYFCYYGVVCLSTRDGTGGAKQKDKLVRVKTVKTKGVVSVKSSPGWGTNVASLLENGHFFLF